LWFRRGKPCCERPFGLRVQQPDRGKQNVSDGHGRPQKFFQGGGKVDILLIFLWFLTMQRKLTYTKEILSNVTAAVTYSAFLVRKLYTEQMFALVSMDILRLS